VVSARAFDELGGLCGDELLAEVFIDLNFDGFHQFGGSFRSGGQVDVEGHFLGAVVHFFISYCISVPSPVLLELSTHCREALFV